MSFTVTSHELADAEVTKASQNYDSKHLGVGHSFLAEFNRAIEVIREHPEAAPVGSSVRQTVAL
jgi:hypothetical protein